MGSNDSLDRTLAARFAWRHAPPGETPSVDGADLDAEAGTSATHDPHDPHEPEGDPELAVREMRSLEAVRAAARAECARLSEAVDRTWRISDVTLQSRATEQLARHAASLGLRAAAMSEHPLQAVRLLRLVTRYYDSIEDEAREALVQCVVWLDLDHPELAELAVELITRGADDLLQQVLFHLSASGSWKTDRVAATWGPPLAALAEREGLPWPQRLLALSFLELAPRREVAPALRRLLRAPHLGVRSVALAALRGIGPDAVTDDDVTFMLRDLVAHELPELLRGGAFEHAHGYARNLTELVVAHRPPCAAAVLAGLVRAREQTPAAWGIADSLWALRALAAALPDEALPLVDDWLTHAREHDRLAATESIARLPPDLARPRLLRAAADGAPEVALRAQEIWLELYGTHCPLAPLAGVATSLLEAPPSEVFHGRLMVLRGRPLEARARMVEALLAESPSREALALLVFALGADDVWRHNERPRLPGDQPEWVRTLVRRFGRAGAAAVAELAGRHSIQTQNGWFQAVTWTAHTYNTAPEDLAPLRDLAARVMLDGRYRFAQSDASKVLRAIGVPADLADPCFEAIDRVDTPGTPGAPDGALTATHAADLLSAVGPDPDVDRRVALGLDDALRAGAAERAGHYARVGVERDVAPVVTCLLTLLDTPGALGDVTTEATQRLAGATRALARKGLLTRSWVLRALEPDPSLRGHDLAVRDATRRFQLACVLVRAGCDDETCALLQTQLTPGGALSPETAALAANVLLFHQKLPWDEAAIAPIVEAVDDALRVSLLHHALYHEHPFASLWGAFARAFSSRDPAVVARLARLVDDYPEALLEPLRAEPAVAIADPALAALVERALDPDDEDTYWLDE